MQNNRPKNQIEVLTNDLNRLYAFKPAGDVSATTTWLNECLAIFEFLGISETILEKFILRFDPAQSKSHSYQIKANIGEVTESIHQNSKEINSIEFYRQLVFRVAYKKLALFKEEERLVPSWLITTFSESMKYPNFATLLSAVQDAYAVKNPNLLCINSITLLDNILNLSDEIKDKRKIGQKITPLIENKELREKFGISEDMAKSLNCSRIIRNEKIIHSTANIKNDIPLLVAVGFAYLVIFFLEITLATGELINE